MSGADLGNGAPSTGAENATTQKNIACPYSKHPELKHLHPDCREVILRSIADLKLHFRRRHKRLPFCFVCKLTFPGDSGHADCDHHIKQQTCLPNDNAEPPGHSKDEIDELFRHKRKRAIGQAEKHRKWHCLWDTLFPGMKRPSSIFHECPSKQEWLKEIIERYSHSDVLRNLLTLQCNMRGVSRDVSLGFTTELLASLEQYASQPAPSTATENNRQHTTQPVPSGEGPATTTAATPATGSSRPRNGTSGTIQPDPTISNPGHVQDLARSLQFNSSNRYLYAQAQPAINNNPIMAPLQRYPYPSVEAVLQYATPQHQIGRRLQPAAHLLPHGPHAMPGGVSGYVYQEQPNSGQESQNWQRIVDTSLIDPELLQVTELFEMPELPGLFRETGPLPEDQDETGDGDEDEEY
ncbi:hypothetical protein QBC38DRAFT_492529 [Podospora fimiseda]|uniref:Uncharacterized protein n=1 Tax=Podospora fimiseda TaxID=252190 RepID=A0AAN6YR00_9PEZI|nr:hypothetical protein QBC38DRAFT_492529 [Podospora fimiseda]